MTPEELELMAFDPPYLGMPAGPCRCGRSERDGEEFVEIFVRSEENRITDVGFLTSIHGEGILCASLCCHFVLGKTLDEALSLDEHRLMNHFPQAMHTATLRNTAVLCLTACRQALPIQNGQ